MNHRKYVSLAFREELPYIILSFLPNIMFYKLVVLTLLKLPL